MFEKKLFGLEKNGDFKVWSITVHDDKVIEGDTQISAFITITHGKEGGKQQTKIETITEGKQGRNAYEQAVSQAEGRIKKQLDKNYRETKDELTNIPIIAMLSKDASMEKLDELDLPYEEGLLVSDKLDGVRCLAKYPVGGEITLESRTGQPYDVPHIIEELKLVMQPGDILDGELYVHGPVLQDITSAVKRTDPQEKINKAYLKVAKTLNKNGAGSPEHTKAKTEYDESIEIGLIRGQLEFRVFDLIQTEDKLINVNTPFYLRLNALNAYADNRFVHGGKVFKVGYITVFSKEELRAAHKDAVERGFEGVMFRLLNGLYESGKRSSGLYKYKEFMDAEFFILDVEPDKEGNARFVLRNNVNDNEFTCVMGTMEERLEYLTNKHLYILRWLNVQFQSRFKKTLLPQFPTGVMFRECDEQGNPIE